MKAPPLLAEFSIPITRESSNALSRLLGADPLKLQRSQQIRTELSSLLSIITNGADYIFFLIIHR